MDKDGIITYPQANHRTLNIISQKHVCMEMAAEIFLRIRKKMFKARKIGRTKSFSVFSSLSCLSRAVVMAQMIEQCLGEPGSNPETDLAFDRNVINLFSLGVGLSLKNGS